MHAFLNVTDLVHTLGDNIVELEEPPFVVCLNVHQHIDAIIRLGKRREYVSHSVNAKNAIKPTLDLLIGKVSDSRRIVGSAPEWRVPRIKDADALAHSAVKPTRPDAHHQKHLL